MSPISRQLALAALALLMVPGAEGQSRIEGRDPSRRFVSAKYGFSIPIPNGWHASLEKDTPLYVNFDPTGVLQQLKLPSGGATIVVVAQESLPGRSPLGTTPSSWAVADARGIAARSPAVRPLEMPEASGVSGAVISSYDEATYGPDDQAQHCVAVFWEMRHKLFAAHLNYIVGDPKGPELEELLLQVIRGIRPL